AGATNVADWTDSVWLTRDRKRPNPSKGDMLLATLPHHGALAVGDSYQQLVTVTLLTKIDGQFFLTPWSDSLDQVLEDTFDVNINPDDPHELDNNNFKARPITVLGVPPDLVVTALSGPAEGRGGEPFTVGWTVTNQGLRETRDDAWVDDVYLADSADPKTSVRRWLLGRIPHSGVLGVNESY